MRDFEDIRNQIVYIEVHANVRYTEDATLNGVEDVNGDMPCMKGSMWCPIIRIEDGKVINWPVGNTASIHYKVCDAGCYYLTDIDMKRLAIRENEYVPNDYLCHGGSGWGDYIIMSIDENGFIKNYTRPYIDESDWEAISDE